MYITVVIGAIAALCFIGEIIDVHSQYLENKERCLKEATNGNGYEIKKCN